MDETVVPAGLVAFRAPLLPYAAFAGLAGGAARAAWEADGDLGAAVAADLRALDERLRALVADPLVREALALSSPSLDGAVARWLARPGAPPPRALVAYAGRLAARCVPYGLSAGCAGGTAAGPPEFTLAPRAAARTRRRADVTRVAPAADTYVPNTTLHAAGGRLRYVERDRGYHPATVEESEPLARVLAAARAGATLDGLARTLVDDEITYDDAVGFVAELVAAQLLVPDAPVVTAPPAAGEEHADLSRPGAFALGDAVVAEARRAVEVLRPLWRPTPADEALGAFAAAFGDRYGAAEVPLLEALDEEVGVGFGGPAAVSVAGGPLLAGLRPPPDTDGPRWTPIDHHLLDLLSRALRDGATEIALDHGDLHPLRNQHDPRPLPDAFALRGTVAAASAAAVAAGDFRLVVHDVTGPSGAGVLARFADLDDGVGALVRDHLAREEALRPDAVFAEVVHLPDGRAANAAVRPVLRPYELPLLAAPAAPPDRRVTPDDLLVSVVDGHVLLRSRRLGREVVPRLTAAHDAWTSALPAYRFLAALQSDRVAGTLRWSWGQARTAPYLPRVVAGRLVLARQQWWWFRTDLRPLASAGTDAAAYAALQRLRDEWRVPRWAALTRGDYELPVDLDNVATAGLLAREARRAGQLMLREQYPGPDALCLTGEEGAFAHEFVLPFTVATPASRPAPRERPRGAAYVPGSGRLSALLRTGPVAADGVLREVVAPLVADAAEWSYERVEGGLRLVLPGGLLAGLRDRVAPLVADGRVADLTLETYRSPGEAAERLAHADSVAALRVLSAGDDLEARWQAAYWGIDRLLADAGLDTAGRLAAATRMRDRLVAAYGETGRRAVRVAGRVHRAGRPRPAPDWLAAVLDARSAAVAPLLAGAPEEVLDGLCAAHAGRLLRAAFGTQQLVLADLLGRRHRAELERATRRPGGGTS